jgi:hypothetical protein
MAAGASMEMGSTSFAVLWTQSSGGTISQGVGDPCLVSFKNGEFRKEGAGAFNIEPRFVGNGRLTLLDGAIVGKGEFLLNEGSLVTGGGIENPGANVRLILIDSPSAQLNGTIRPGVEGQLMHMGIQGNVSLGSTFRVELDVPLEGDILAESLNFQTGGQALAGTLEVRVGRPTEPGDSVRVVRTTQGTGKFDAILGAEPFTVVTEDEDGVLMARPN